MSDTKPRPDTRSGLSPLKAIWPYLFAERGFLFAWLGALLLSSSATLVLPIAVRQMIDHGFSVSDAAMIDRYFLALLAVAVILAVATALRFYFVSMLGERVVAKLRRSVYDRLLALDQTFYESTRIGEVQSRLTTDTELVQTVVGSSASIAVRSAVTLLGAGALLIWTSPKLAAWAALGIPLIVLPLIIYGRRVRTLSRQSQDRVADVAAETTETLHAIHTIQSYTREPMMRERFGGIVAALLRTASQRNRTRGLLTAMVIVAVFGAVTLVLWIGARAVIGGQMTPGELGQFVLYAVILAGSLGALSEVYGDVQRAAGAMERVQELLSTEPSIRSAPQALPLRERLRGAIGFDRVTFYYPSRPDHPALHEFDLRIAPGETVALVGPSGAGKTTVLQLLMRFYDPQSGRITIDDHALTDLRLDDVRGAMALVPQDPIMFGASARANIAIGQTDASAAQIESAAGAAEAAGFLHEMPQGFDTFLGERGVRLSGGQQQRIAIARAVLKDAPILLLDEATSALDAQSEALIQRALEKLMVGRTTLVIAHRLATVLKADRIVVMERGRIVAEGTHRELVARGGLYGELARLQFDKAG